MLLRGPRSFLGIGHNPEAKVALAIIDLIDHFDDPAERAGHEARARREGEWPECHKTGSRTLRPTLSKGASSPSATISMALSVLVGEMLYNFSPGRTVSPTPVVRHLHHGAVDRSKNATGDSSLASVGLPEGHIGQLIGGSGCVAECGVAGRFGFDQSL